MHLPDVYNYKCLAILQWLCKSKKPVKPDSLYPMLHKAYCRSFNGFFGSNMWNSHFDKVRHGESNWKAMTHLLSCYKVMPCILYLNTKYIVGLEKVPLKRMLKTYDQKIEFYNYIFLCMYFGIYITCVYFVRLMYCKCIKCYKYFSNILCYFKHYMKLQLRAFVCIFILYTWSLSLLWLPTPPLWSGLWYWIHALVKII